MLQCQYSSLSCPRITLCLLLLCLHIQTLSKHHLSCWRMCFCREFPHDCNHLPFRTVLPRHERATTRSLYLQRSMASCHKMYICHRDNGWSIHVSFEIKLRAWTTWTSQLLMKRLSRWEVQLSICSLRDACPHNTHHNNPKSFVDVVIEVWLSPV